MWDIDEDCSVRTDMEMIGEVIGFITAGIKHGMSNEEVIEWCDDSVYDLSKIYEKYRGTPYSYVDAAHVLFFTHSIHDHSDMVEMLETFVACQ